MTADVLRELGEKSGFAWLPQDVFAIGNLDAKELR
jgi:hypothetical protein